jgi:hypothetical protein
MSDFAKIIGNGILNPGDGGGGDPDPPVPVSAVFFTATNRIMLEFDRDITLADSDTSVWAYTGESVEPNGVFQTNANTLRLTFSEFHSGNLFYSPLPDAVVGDPDGVPVEAFSNFTVTIE